MTNFVQNQASGLIGRGISAGGIIPLVKLQRVGQRPQHGLGVLPTDRLQFPVEESCAAIKDESGESVGTVLIFRDITERRLEQSALVRNELELLNAIWSGSHVSTIDIAHERAQLLAINQALWDIEDAIRLKERAQAFDQEFIELARSVYFRNDERAACKRAINLKLGSELVEEKSYQDYRAG